MIRKGVEGQEKQALVMIFINTFINTLLVVMSFVFA